jgi:hypothetical protein
MNHRYRDVMAPTSSTPPAAPPPAPAAVNPSPYMNHLADAMIASLALVIVTAGVCLLAELPARLVLLAALTPWGLLGLGRSLALASALLEEFLRLIGHPRDLNRDGQIGFAVQVSDDSKEPWK